jgi:hypothetical protein
VTNWAPEWRVKINAVEYTDVTLSNLTITSGRTDIYQQPVAGYCALELINLNTASVTVSINDGLTVEVKDGTGAFVPIFGGSVSDVAIEVARAGSTGYSQVVRIVALGALSRLPKALTDGVLSHDFDGDQIYTILSAVLFANWNAVPAATTWAAYDPAQDWTDAENTGLGEIDRPGDYELRQRSASVTDVYSLVSALATSGFGYIYEDSAGRIGYADATHRSEYLAANGYLDVSANDAIGSGLSIRTRGGDVRNDITLAYGNNYGSEVTASDPASIAIYGDLAAIINTTIRHTADAQEQADRYLSLRGYPRATFDSITYALTNPELSDGDRNTLIAVFMGLPMNVTNLPINMNDGEFQGFVEGWTFRASFNTLSITVNLSPVAFSLTAFRWNSVPISESWNTLSPTLDWEHATVVA